MIYRAINELKLLDYNPRTIDEKQFNVLCDSIRKNPEYFEARPIILSDRTGDLVVIAGNQRLRASTHIGLDKVPTKLISGLSLEDEKEIVIRDNISNGQWDWDNLSSGFWNEFELEDWGLEGFPFEQPETQEIERDDSFDICDKCGSKI